MKPVVIVGLSGGLDSFAAALLLKREGFRIIGLNLSLWKRNVLSETEELCRRLDIEPMTYDGRELFRQQVVLPFVSQYLAGRTPNPCALCNNTVKWRLLSDAADQSGAGYIATGHYVRIKPWGKHYYVWKGIDPRKDQSYFLWGVGEEVLRRAYTPLGEYTKAEIRALAMREGYEDMARKRESMGICFLEGKDYREFIFRQCGKKGIPQAGNIVDRNGNALGRHTGLLNYTIGQTRDMPLIDGKRGYVAAMDYEKNTIEADIREGLYTEWLYLENLRFIDPEEWAAEDIEIKIRGIGLNPAGFVRISPEGGKKWKVRLASPAWAVAPGQPAAFYRGERLIGGGTVCMK